MSDPKSTLDPEVLALLDEIAADPDSTLLRVPREPLKRFLPLREPPVSPREPLLTRAERHLVQAHREYVARLLFDACRLSLTRDPIEKTRIHRWVTKDQRLEIPVKDKWHSWANQAVKNPPSDPDLSFPLRLLQRCASGETSTPASELASASLRLVPCDATRIWLGVALHREGQSRSAMHTLQDVLAHRPSPANELWARMDCGFVSFGCARYEQAVDWYRSAASVQEDPAIPVLSWFSSALQLGNREEASKARARLDEVVDPRHPTVNELTVSLRTVAPSIRCKKLLSGVRGKLSPVARSIVDALLH